MMYICLKSHIKSIVKIEFSIATAVTLSVLHTLRSVALYIWVFHHSV